jgi:peptide/nickel transport system substrate-binding protein
VEESRTTETDLVRALQEGRLDRRDFLRLSGGGMLAALLGAHSLATANGAAAQDATSKLIVVYESEPTNLDPHAFGSKGDDAMRMNVGSQLIRRKVTEGEFPNTWLYTAEFEGALAESFSEDTANKKYVFKLKPGLTFSNGDPITANDAVWSFHRAMLSPTSYVGQLFAMLTITTPEQIVAPDASTVELHYDQPNPFVWDLMSITVTAVLNQKAYEANATAEDQWATEWAMSNIVSGGAYVVKESTRGVQVVLAPNPNHWEEGSPKNAETVVKVVPNPSDRLLLLKSGDVDVVRGIAFKDLHGLEGQPGITLLNYPTTEIWWMGMNAKVPPFDNKLVRQAVAWAFPYQDILDNVWYGFADPMTSPIPQGMPAHDGSAWAYKTDLAKAQELLTQAGFPDGFETRIVVNPSNVEDSASAVWIQSGLDKVGIKVTIDKQAEAAINDTLFAKRDAPLFLFNWISYVNDPYYHAFWLLKSDAGTNFSNFGTPRIDELIATGMYETDLAKREEMAKEFQAIWADETPWVYMAQPRVIFAMTDKVQGFAYFFDEIMRFWFMHKTA